MQELILTCFKIACRSGDEADLGTSLPATSLCDNTIYIMYINYHKTLD